MGTVSQLHDRLRPAAHRIESEEEAVAAARRLAADFRRQSSERDINRILPYSELDSLSLSGLTAITVPPEYEGLDVSNALLAEIVAIIAEKGSQARDIRTACPRMGCRSRTKRRTRSVSLTSRAYQPASFFLRSSLSCAGFALPPVAFITCPTKKPNSLSLPER